MVLYFCQYRLCAWPLYLGSHCQCAICHLDQFLEKTEPSLLQKLIETKAISSISEKRKKSKEHFVVGLASSVGMNHSAG